MKDVEVRALKNSVKYKDAMKKVLELKKEMMLNLDNDLKFNQLQQSLAKVLEDISSRLD